MSDPTSAERIMEEATRLFAEKGYAATSVREVAEAAQVTKPTLYYHYGSKEDLFLAAVRAQTDRLQRIVCGALDGDGSVRLRLRFFVETMLRNIRENPVGMRLLMTVPHRPDRGQPKVDLMSIHRRNGDLLQGLIRHGMQRGEIRPDIEPMHAVMALVGTVNHHGMSRLHGAPLDEGIVDSILDLFFQGVAVQE